MATSRISGRRPPATVTVTAVMVMVLAAACGGASHTAAPATSSSVPAASTTTVTTEPAGYRAFTDTADQFSIAVPTSWLPMNPTDPAAAQTLKEVIAANPKMQPIWGSGPSSFVATSTKFAAFDVSTIASYTPNVTVVAKPDPGIVDGDLPNLLPGLRTAFTKIGATITSTAPVSLPGHQAFQVTLLYPTTVATAGKFMVAETQDYVAANDTIYILTSVGTAPEFSTIASTFTVS